MLVYLSCASHLHERGSAVFGLAVIPSPRLSTAKHAYPFGEAFAPIFAPCSSNKNTIQTEKYNSRYKLYGKSRSSSQYSETRLLVPVTAQSALWPAVKLPAG